MTVNLQTQTKTQAGIATLLSVVSAVAVVAVSDALGASPAMKLVGAALGAAIPPAIGVASTHWPLRLTAGLAVIGVALVFTYGGFTIFDYATKPQTATFPQLPGLPKPSPQSDTSSQSLTNSSSTSSPPRSTRTCDGDLCITVDPQTLDCTQGSCDGPVTIQSSGSATLRINSIGVDGANANDFQPNGDCQDQDMPAGSACSFTVSFSPTVSNAAENARLVINQNLSGPASFVTLVGNNSNSIGTGGPDLALSAPQRCSIVPGGSLSGADALTIEIAIINNGPGSISQLVPYALSSDGGLSGTGNAAVSTDGGVTPMQVDLQAGDYNQDQQFTITVDPKNVIPETNENNNTLSVTVSLPSQPTSPTDVPCS
jgi:CARDB